MQFSVHEASSLLCLRKTPQIISASSRGKGTVYILTNADPYQTDMRYCMKMECANLREYTDFGNSAAHGNTNANAVAKCEIYQTNLKLRK